MIMTRFTGSCRCHTVRFECELGAVPAAGNDAALTHDFRLLAGDHALEIDEAAITNHLAMNFFCARCGAALVSRERTPSGMRYTVNVAALDNIAAFDNVGGKEVTQSC